MSTPPLTSLASFTVERILSDSALLKQVAVLGRFDGSDAPAIVIFSKRHFAVNDIQGLAAGTTLSADFSNDIYAKYTGTCSEAFSRITVDTIYPCTPKHVSKHSTQAFHVVHETPALYATRSKPFIDGLPAAAIQWVYNVLEKREEADRILFEDPDPSTGFILAPDLKWDQVQVQQLHCLALVHRRDLKSLRDVDESALPLLRNLLEKGRAAIGARYNVPASQLKAYLHYHPSYYHLHVHFSHAGIDAAAGQLAGKAHLLATVIDNVAAIAGDYYRRATLPCVLGENDPLYRILAAA